MSTLSTINVKHPSSASNNVVLDNSGNATIANNATVTGNATVSGNITVTGTGSVGGNLSFNSGYGSAAVAYGCRAWVNFNGTGTVAIRASGNVTSITDVGVGTYTVNFTSALVDANYSVSFASAHTFNSTNGDQGWANLRANNGGTNPQQTTSLAIWASSKASSLGAAVDNEIVDVAVFR